MREIVRALCSKQEGRIASVRVCARMGKRFVTVARFYVKEHTPKINDDDPDGNIEPLWLETEGELEDAITEELEELEQEGDADGWRVFAYNDVAKQIGSKMRSFVDDDDDDDEPRGKGGRRADPTELALSFMGAALRDVVAEFPRTLRESRLTLGVLTDTLGKREDISLRAVELATTARIGEAQARADADVIELANTAQAAIDAAVAAAPDDETTNTTADRAIELLERFFGRITGGGAPTNGHSNGAAAAAAVNWDEVADAVADDPALQAALGAKFAAAQERAAARRAAAGTSSSSSSSTSRAGKRKRKSAAPPPPEPPQEAAP